MPSTCCHTTLPQRRAPGCSAPPRELPRRDPVPWKGKQIRMERTGPWRFPPSPDLLCSEGCPPLGWGQPCSLHGFQVCHPSKGHPAATPFPLEPPGLQACRCGPGDSVRAHHQASSELRAGGWSAEVRGPPWALQRLLTTLKRGPGRRKALPSAQVPGSPGGRVGMRSCVFPFPAPTTKPFFKEGLLSSLCPAAPVTLGKGAPSQAELTPPSSPSGSEVVEGGAAAQALLPGSPPAGSCGALPRGAEMTSRSRLRFCGVFGPCRRKGSRHCEPLRM